MLLIACPCCPIFIQSEEEDDDDDDSDSNIGSQELEDRNGGGKYKPGRALVSSHNESHTVGSTSSAEAQDLNNSGNSTHLNLASLCATVTLVSLVVHYS